jgi:hypothetical protein
LRLSSCRAERRRQARARERSREQCLPPIEAWSFFGHPDLPERGRLAWMAATVF